VLPCNLFNYPIQPYYIIYGKQRSIPLTKSPPCPPCPPCPPWRDSESKMLMQSKPGLGQGRDSESKMLMQSKPGLG